MRNLIVVVFVEPVAEGLEFPRENWPLHITVVKFDVAAADNVAGLMAEPVAAALGVRVTVGGDARFGRAGSILVSLIDRNPQLQALHNDLVRIVTELPGRISTPGYTLAGYRPHISHHGGKRPRQGDVVALDRIALVDMAPGGTHATRRILRLWTA
ncbi:2'-5' RNA ligase family protein [Arthrobacter sp. PAMC25284]|uniref:2'-5' RNA ligase family protein n=1 Tax=Arthrobacter sp. PAMC25284 TaxID=2861279 RepID=UPI001C626F8D|nr:2'-5' RNA ligase family protein [Arthrobacter sp. PAMC25284]QYF88791.1 2'-5' RNA ligase family protein [Arthrobacter sp. PAMC25284]